MLAAGTAAVYSLSLARTFNANRVVLDDTFPEDESRPPTPEPDSPSADAYNILLLGSDTRGTIGSDIDNVSGSRADTIMVVHIPSDRESVQVMSIMRDNWVPIEGHGYAKINAALAYGGVPLMISTVENFVGARIDHIAVIDFEGFQGLTDALGGVTVDNSQAFSADGYQFGEGKQQLNGKEALAFVRERHAFADGDYQRARNQQTYLRGVISKTLSKGTLVNPKKVYDVVDAISPFLAVDSGLDAQYIGGLAVDMRDIRSGDIRFFTSPTLGTGTEGAQSVVRPDWDRIDEVRQHFQDDDLSEYDPGPGG